MPDTMLQGLRDYFLTCPLLADGKIQVNSLPEETQELEYSITPSPDRQVLKQYINGDSRRQLSFLIHTVEAYSSDFLASLDRCGLFEQLEEWVEEKNNALVLPSLPGGKEAEWIEVQSTLHPINQDTQTGSYQIQCRLIYRQTCRKE